MRDVISHRGTQTPVRCAPQAPVTVLKHPDGSKRRRGRGEVAALTHRQREWKTVRLTGKAAGQFLELLNGGSKYAA